MPNIRFQSDTHFVRAAEAGILLLILGLKNSSFKYVNDFKRTESNWEIRCEGYSA